MNEAEFVRFLKDKFPFKHGTGIGDDTSVVKINDCYQLITKDILIENVHFNLDYFTLEEVALKSIAANISDITAMGGEPLYFYLGLGFPGKLEKEKITDFFNALEKGCKQWKVELAGGDFSSSSVLFVSITMVGKTRNPIYRNNAQNGDLIGITGVTGESTIGLKMLQKGIKTGYMIQKHKTIQPEIEKGAILSKYVNSMIDLSDGLLIDLKRVLAASSKGAKITYENIPVTEEIRKSCAENSLNEYEMVLAGGEDYILLFTVTQQKDKELRKENISYYIIGEINNNPGELIVEKRGKLLQIQTFGYDHFQFIL